MTEERAQSMEEVFNRMIKFREQELDWKHTSEGEQVLTGIIVDMFRMIKIPVDTGIHSLYNALLTTAITFPAERKHVINDGFTLQKEVLRMNLNSCDEEDEDVEENVEYIGAHHTH